MIHKESDPDTAPSVAGTRVLALLPFLVDGSRPLGVLREMRHRGMDVVIAVYLDGAHGLDTDPCLDFDRDGRLVDMTPWIGSGVDKLESLVDEHATQLVLQIGSPLGYSQLPVLKERRPDLRIIDWLLGSDPYVQFFTYHARAFDGCLVESTAVARSLADIPGVGEVRRVESGIDLGEFLPRGRTADEPPSAPAEARFDRDRMMDGYAAAFAQWIDTPPRPLAVVEEGPTPASLIVRDVDESGSGGGTSRAEGG